MKKTFKKIAKSIMLAFVMLLSSVSIIACSKGTTGNVGPKVENINNITAGQEIVSGEVTDAEAPVEETLTINGIFKFTRDFNFDDINYSDLKELLAFFNTRDLNGVYHEVEKVGFDEFAKNLTKLTLDQSEIARAIQIENNKVTNLTYTDSNVYSYVDAEKNFEYTVKDNKIETAEHDPIMEYDEDSKTLTIYYQFSYEGPDDKIIYTPLYVKTTLSLVEYSESIENATSFVYSENSSKIVTTVDTTDMTLYLESLASMFGIEDKTAINESITSILQSWTLKIDSKYDKIVLVNADSSFSISKNVADSFTFNGTLTAKITESYKDLTSNKLVVTFVVELDAETIFTFNFVA